MHQAPLHVMWLALRCLAGACLCAGLATAQEPVILRGSSLPGQKMHLGKPADALLALPDAPLAIPLTLPPGRVSITAHLRSNSKDAAFLKYAVAIWTGPMVARAPAESLAAGTPLVMNFVTRRPGPTVLRIVWELPPEAALKRRDLRQTADAAEGKPGDLSWMDDKGDVVKEFKAEVDRDLVLDATTMRVPLLLLDRVEVAPLPPPTLVPEIANVVPAFRTPAPFIVLGEGFDQPDLEVWTWQPAADTAETEAGLAEMLAGGRTVPLPALPAQPPAGAVRAEFLDQDTQTLTVPLAGDMLWLKNRHGWSQPYLNNIPRAHWLSRDTVPAGETLFLYGYALRHRNDSPGRVVLIREGKAAPVKILPDGDRYFAELEVPRETPPGDYTVAWHNGLCGRFGWVAAGKVTVTAPPAAERLFNVADYGANGDDLASDREALLHAMKTAAAAGGGVVLLPPGCFRVEQTLEVPENVILCGAARGKTALEGFGYDRATRSVSVEYGEMSFQAPTLVVLKSGAGLQRLIVRGVPAKGLQRFPCYPLVFTAGTRDVRIEDSLLYGPPEEEETDVPQHATVLTAEGARHLRVADCELVGQLQLDSCYRLDLLRNRIRQAISELLSVELRSCHNIRVDGNTILDGAGRLCPIEGCAHGLFRNNRILYKFRSDIASGEGFLAHGDIPQAATPGAPPELLGFVTVATATTVTDRAWRLKPGLLRGSTIHLTSGRGFGQYRVVADNTADTLTLERPWNVIPDVTSHYVLRFLFPENAWVGNRSLGHAVSAWYNDHLGCVWEGHRDEYNSAYLMGADIRSRTTADVPVETGHLGVSAYNLFLDCQFNASRLNLDGIQQFEPARPQAPLFANFIVGCSFSQPLLSRDNNWSGASAEASGMVACVTLSFLNKYGLPTSGPSDRGEAWPGVSHTIFQGNRFSQAPIGLRIGPMVRKTFILDNDFRDITYHPWQDGGAESLYRGNRRAETQGTAMTEPKPFGDGRNARVIPVPRDDKPETAKTP